MSPFKIPEPSVHGEPSHLAPGRLFSGAAAGVVYAATYWVGNTADKVMVDDEAFVSAVSDVDAAKRALLRETDARLAGLIWTRKIGVVPVKGILARKGKVGPLDVLFIEGPTFDLGRRSDDAEAARRAARGTATGLPGSRRIVVANRNSFDPL